MEPDDIYFVEAEEGDCLVRLRGSRQVCDVRTLGQMEDLRRPTGSCVPNPPLHRPGSRVQPGTAPLKHTAAEDLLAQAAEVSVSTRARPH